MSNIPVFHYKGFASIIFVNLFLITNPATSRITSDVLDRKFHVEPFNPPLKSRIWGETLTRVTAVRRRRINRTRLPLTL